MSAPAQTESILPLFLQALDAPRHRNGAEQVARQALVQCPPEVLLRFVDKVSLTAGDGESHSAVVVTPPPNQVGIMLQSWYGHPSEVLAQRYGTYLEDLLNWVHGLSGLSVKLAAFLQIDTFVTATAGSYAVELEYTFWPGGLAGFPADEVNPYPYLIAINQDLCTPDQLRQLHEAFS